MGPEADAPSPAGRTSVLVRPALAADADALGELHVATWRAAYRGLLPDALLDGLSIPERQAKWRGWLAPSGSPETGTLVADLRGRPVGFSRWGRSRDDDAATRPIGELFAIYVEAALWGTGVGLALHERTIDAGRSTGFDEMTLWVVRANDRARRFYARQGWRPDGGAAKKPFRGAVLDEVRYRRAL